MSALGKVTTFITRQRDGQLELLLFEHPFAGNQIPAGTLEAGETPPAAALREAREETGLAGFTIRAALGSQISAPPDGMAILGRATPAYAHPDPLSWGWVQFPRGPLVTVHQRANGYTQVTFTEQDRDPAPRYVTFQITAWVPDDALAEHWERHFFHLEYTAPTPERWTVHTDGHLFTLFWAPLAALPPLAPPQDTWPQVLIAARGA